MIAVLIVCIAVCFLAPLAVVRPPHLWRRPALEHEEVGAVSALLAGRLPARDYHDSMARLARLTARLSQLQTP